MKRSTEKEILLAAGCATAFLGAYFLVLRPAFAHTQPELLRAFLFPGYSFCVLAGLFLFRGARWGRIALSATALSTALVLGWWVVRVFERVFLVSLGKPGVTFTMAGVQFGRLQFFMLLASVALVALIFGIFGWLVLKERWPEVRKISATNAG